MRMISDGVMMCMVPCLRASAKWIRSKFLRWHRDLVPKIKKSLTLKIFFQFQHLAEGSRIHSQLQSSLILLAKTKEKYEKAFGASERALDAYKKADEDLNLSRAEVEKQRMNSTIKTQQCEDAKNEYANQLQKTNEWQVGKLIWWSNSRS